MSLLNTPPQGDASPEATAAVNARFYPALAGLGLIVALLTAGTALSITAPQADELLHRRLQVEEVGEVVLERNQQHMGYSLFLAQPKPPELQQQGMLFGVKSDWLPFHRNLHLTPEQIEAWDAQTPATLDVSTYEGMVVAIAHDSDVWLSTDDFAQALARKRMQRWWMAAAGLLLAVGAGLMALKTRRSPMAGQRGGVR